jgi:hypothetical protein
MSKNEAMVKERIDKDLAEHVIEQRHSAGLYRHWRCGKPSSSDMSFHIVTWPGSLCYTGDMGDYLFRRTDDMVAFMRSACRDYYYAAEKCIASCDDGIREFSSECFDKEMKEVLEENPDNREKILEIRLHHDTWDGDANETIKAMHESGIWDGCDMPSCEDYAYRFLWCLHAIKWFCEKISTEPVLPS